VPTVTVEGAVDRVTFYNPENGFSVLRLRVRGKREPISVVGTWFCLWMQARSRRGHT